MALESLGLIDDANKIFNRLATEEPSSDIPEWVRNNAQWWAQGAIGDNDFTTGIQFLIKEGVITIPETTKTTEPTNDQEIPSWVKNNADW